MDYKILLVLFFAAVAVIEFTEAQRTNRIGLQLRGPFRRPRQGRRFRRLRGSRRCTRRQRRRGGDLAVEGRCGDGVFATNDGRIRGVIRGRIRERPATTERPTTQPDPVTRVEQLEVTPPPVPTRPSTPRNQNNNNNNDDDFTILVREFINNDEEMIPNLVQMVFHTCVGGCDGCLNFNEPDNRGLRASYPQVRRFCEQRLTSFTLADCIVFMASKAVEMGMAKSSGIGRISINFRRGRQTCPDPDNYNENHEFPKGDHTDGVEFLMREFGLNSRKQAIALLGAHSLGRCRVRNSGFDGKWDNTELILDNGYYKSMVGTDWRLREIGSSFQWSSAGESRMMLMADMALVRNVTGRPTCQRARDCPRNNGDADEVANYSRDEAEWADDFSRAFEKMCDN